MTAADCAVVLVGGNIVAPEGVLRDGWMQVDDGLITGVGRSEPPDGVHHDISAVGGKWIVPGFIDAHCHGGGGGSFLNGDDDEIRTAADFHRRNGTTSLLASMISAPHEHLLRASRSLARAVRSNDTLIGIHLEGPFLSHAFCGAHDPRHLRPPTADEARELIKACDGYLRQMTFAPELAGSDVLLQLLCDAGVVGAIGHTNATAEQTRSAIDNGARFATHICNAMPVPHHRNGGPAVALMNDDRVFIEVINDWVHLDAEYVRHIVKSVGAHRICMITDAVQAAGLADGRHKLDGREVDLHDGVVRLATPDAPLAGSVLTMARSFRNTATLTRSLVSAARMCSTTPAAALGLNDRGALVRSLRADFVVLSGSLDVVEVWQRGECVVRNGGSRPVDESGQGGHDGLGR